MPLLEGQLRIEIDVVLRHNGSREELDRVMADAEHDLIQCALDTRETDWGEKSQLDAGSVYALRQMREVPIPEPDPESLDEHYTAEHAREYFIEDWLDFEDPGWDGVNLDRKEA